MLCTFHQSNIEVQNKIPQLQQGLTENYKNAVAIKTSLVQAKIQQSHLKLEIKDMYIV